MEKRKAGMSKGKLVTITTAPRFRLRRLAVAVAVAMASSRADALGLGDLELHSALNQPLSAEVRLLVDNPKELEGAAVVLAPNDEFVRAGIERPPELSDLKFDIVSDKGGALVKITSSQPIREPFLDFVVQLQWPAGRLLREYTVLLDPPVFGPEQHTAAVASPATAAPPSAPQAAESVNSAPPAGPPAAPPVSAPGAPPPRRPAAAPVPAAGLAGAATYGPTKRNDTLWDIASQVRPDDSVSVYQMMLALLKANPEAFYNSNINSLKAGYVLRVPDKSTAAALPEDRAVEEAVRQYRQWRLARGGVTAQAASPPPAQQASAAAPAAGQNQDKDAARLRLVAPAEGAGGAAASGTQAQLNKLRSDLALALESSDSAKRESDELRSRVSALEGQINSLQRLLTLKDQALSDVQKRAGLPVPAAPVVEETSATAVTPAAKPAEVAKPKPKPAAVPPEAPASGLMDDPAIVGAASGAALLLLSVGWLMVRRRSAKAEGEPMRAPMVEEEPSPPINIRLGGTSPAEEPEQAATYSDNPQMIQVAEEVAQRAEQDIPRTANDLDVMATPEGEIDPIVEADVYLAYRRYQQAESLVQTALSKQPERKDLQAKLLDIYYAAKNAASFREVAENLYINLGSNAQDPVWQRILPMGRELCPDSELFAPAEDHSHESPAAPVSETHPMEAAPADDDKMEFDLNMDAANVGEETAMTAALAVTDPVKEAESWESERVVSDFGSLDFGLDDGDLLAGTDVVGTKLDLARAYIDMGDADSAWDILKEVTEEGNDQQKEEAQSLMEKIA